MTHDNPHPETPEEWAEFWAIFDAWEFDDEEESE